MAAMSYLSSYFHCVFSTKERRPLTEPALRERLWPFLGGIARQNGMKLVNIGGMPDHVHLLLSLPSTLSVAKALQLIKGGSSKWVHDTFPEQWLFGWQVKYGAFGVSVSLLERISAYIQNQDQHHRKMSFQEEFLALLEKHRIAYDERYLWEVQPSLRDCCYRKTHSPTLKRWAIVGCPFRDKDGQEKERITQMQWDTQRSLSQNSFSDHQKTTLNLLLSQREIACQGKPLGDWADDLNGQDAAASNRAVLVLNTTIIPKLVYQMFHDTNDSVLRITLIEMLNNCWLEVGRSE